MSKFVFLIVTFTIVGLRIDTKPMAPEIPQLWDQFAPRIGEIKYGAEPQVSYGMMENSSPTMGEMVYMAGISVQKVADVPKGMTFWELPSNTYAVVEATLSTIGQAFDYVYNTWLPASDYQPGQSPFFERYGETFNPAEPNSILSIYIPIEKKK